MKRILIGLLVFFAMNLAIEMAPAVFEPVRQESQVCWAIGSDAVVSATQQRVQGGWIDPIMFIGMIMIFGGLIKRVPGGCWIDLILFIGMLMIFGGSMKMLSRVCFHWEYGVVTFVGVILFIVAIAKYMVSR